MRLPFYLMILIGFAVILPVHPTTVPSEDQLLQPIPTSSLPSTGKNWTHNVITSPEKGVSNSRWSVQFQEEEVFLVNLQHIQKDDEYRSWVLRLGKGGQIYSLTNTVKGVTKEFIPPQYRNPKDKNGKNNAPWVDEVFQLVGVNSQLNKPNQPYFIHQAGIYLRDRKISVLRPFYSPLLAQGTGKEPYSFVTVNWGQQAHVPTPYLSSLIYYTQVRDIGEGIIEISNMAYNYGTDTLDFFSAPFGGTRRTSLGTHVISNPKVATGWEKNDRPYSQGSRPIAQTSGWAAFVEGTKPSHRTLGLVFGFDARPFKGFQLAESLWRWGFAEGLLPQTNETYWRNYLVGELVRKVRLEPGYVLVNRYYLVVDSFKNLQKSIEKYQLAKYAGVDVITFTTSQSPKLSWYLENNELTTTPSNLNSSAIVSTYAYPVKDTQPLFVLKNRTTSQRVLTTDPCYFCLKTFSDGYLRPYDDNTVYQGFLGYIDSKNTVIPIKDETLN